MSFERRATHLCWYGTRLPTEGRERHMPIYGIEVDLESGLDVERLAYQTILSTEDRMEGLRAFAEKRKPIYQGR